MSRSFQTQPAPHYSPKTSVQLVMMQVLLALIPGVAACTWFFGIGVLVQIVLATLFALLFEWIMLKMRGQPVRPFITDGSAIVTAVLFALCLPPLAPWWIALIGMAGAIVLAKHLYGGLGQNVFNPAMVGYVIVLVAFPQAMALWLPAGTLLNQPLGALETLATIFTGNPAGGVSWDAITQATPLDHMRNQLAAGNTVDEARQFAAFGNLGGRGWEWIALFFALGGAWMLWKRVIQWQAPVAVLSSIFVLALLAHLADSGIHAGPLHHLFSGGLVFAAFFIATDPVSGCESTRGRILFGMGVGTFTWIIRGWGGYPDGIAFAVLLMNMAAPLIDRYTRPRMYGQ